MQLFAKNKCMNKVDLVKLLSANTKGAYSADDIFKAADLIENCLKWVPSDRISAFEALEHPFFK